MCLAFYNAQPPEELGHVMLCLYIIPREHIFNVLYNATSKCRVRGKLCVYSDDTISWNMLLDQ